MRRVKASTFWRRHGRDMSSSSRYLFLDFQCPVSASSLSEVSSEDTLTRLRRLRRLSSESELGGLSLEERLCPSCLNMRDCPAIIFRACDWAVAGWSPGQCLSVAGKTRSCGALVLPEACLETRLEGLVACFLSAKFRVVKFPLLFLLDFGSVLSVWSHGWRQSVDTKVGRSLIRSGLEVIRIC
ncbi:hypothetical protein Tco_1359700 [Tanacetum coccineum]